jgi:hypothetical protein
VAGRADCTHPDQNGSRPAPTGTGHDVNRVFVHPVHLPGMASSRLPYQFSADRRRSVTAGGYLSVGERLPWSVSAMWCWAVRCLEGAGAAARRWFAEDWAEAETLAGRRPRPTCEALRTGETLTFAETVNHQRVGSLRRSSGRRPRPKNGGWRSEWNTHAETRTSPELRTKEVPGCRTDRPVMLWPPGGWVLSGPALPAQVPARFWTGHYSRRSTRCHAQRLAARHGHCRDRRRPHRNSSTPFPPGRTRSFVMAQSAGYASAALSAS